MFLPTMSRSIFASALLVVLSSCVGSSRGILLESILQSVKHIENMLAMQYERGLVRLVMPYKAQDLSTTYIADESYDEEQPMTNNRKWWWWPAPASNKIIQIRRALEDEQDEDRPALRMKRKRRPRPLVDDLDIDENVNTNFNSNVNYGRRTSDLNANENYNMNTNVKNRKGYMMNDELELD